MSKTRDLSKVDFFQLLQKEWVTANIRRKIYYKPNDKRYWSKVCSHKKKKIESLSSELGLPSLFEDENIWIDYHTEFRNEGGLPQFQYKQDGSDKDLEITDLLNYYMQGSDIKEVDSCRVGKIIESTEQQVLVVKQVVVEIEGKEKCVELQEICRII